MEWILTLSHTKVSRRLNQFFLGKSSVCLTLNAISITIIRLRLNKSMYDLLKIRPREEIPYFSDALQIIKTWMNNFHSLLWVTVKSWQMNTEVATNTWTIKTNSSTTEYVNSITLPKHTCRQQKSRYYIYQYVKRLKMRMGQAFFRISILDSVLRISCIGYICMNVDIGISPESFELCVQHKCHTTNKENLNVFLIKHNSCENAIVTMCIPLTCCATFSLDFDITP